jgi:hypothetical protein
MNRVFLAVGVLSLPGYFKKLCRFGNYERERQAWLWRQKQQQIAELTNQRGTPNSILLVHHLGEPTP